MTKEEQRSYMIAWRKKQKEKAEAKHKASEIKRFMDQGFTKQEAEQTYEEDREADKNM